MSQKPTVSTPPTGVQESNGVDAATSAMGAAIANREAVLKSLADSRDQVFKLLEARREEAMAPLLRAKELLRSAQVSDQTTHDPALAPALAGEKSTKDIGPTLDDARARFCSDLKGALNVLMALQGAGGTAAEAARDQAIVGIADALAGLVAQEVDKALHR